MRAHFKELTEIEYLYDAKGKKVETKEGEEEKRRFVLRWASKSPTDASVLD